MTRVKNILVWVCIGFGLTLSGCGDGVSNLLGTETTEPSKFEGVDDGVKAKFTKIESIKPHETLTLKVELFSFLSNDALSLTNLSPLSFVPSEVGVEDAAEGELRYTNGFVSRVKLLNPLSCGKFIITDLKIILCPGSMNVAFSSGQNPLVSIGSSLDNMYEVSSGAKASEEFKEIEEEVSVALSDDLDKSEQASGDVVSTDEPTATSTPTISNSFVLGKQPQSHTLTEVSIVGRSQGYTAQVAFAKDYIVLAYIDHPKSERKLRIYNKDFSQGFNLLKEYNFNKIFERLNAVGVSSDGKRIFVAGDDKRDILNSDVVLVEVAYDKATNTFGTEKYYSIANSLLGNFNNDPMWGVIHTYTLEGNPNAVRYVGTGRNNSGNTRLFAVTGEINNMITPMSVTIGGNINPSDVIRSYIYGVLIKDLVPTSYFISYQAIEGDPRDYQHEALIKVGPAPVEIQRDYGAPSILQSVLAPPNGGSFDRAYYLDGTDILATYAASPPIRLGLIRVEPSKGLTWNYPVALDSTGYGTMGSDYDVSDTGNLIVIQTAGSDTERILKLTGVRLSY